MTKRTLIPAMLCAAVSAAVHALPPAALHARFDVPPGTAWHRVLVPAPSAGSSD